ncbi:glutamine amidotransferase-related protein [Demequina sp. SO4-13]|uniref:glutamine amidotransferase-related protein n=1 Tax=Demequina sp. SO4-13 TaxID=3401027 RepID=UPI003AF44EDC
MRCDVIRFVAFEDLGVWEPEITAHGYELRYLEVGVDDLAPAATADLVVVLGAPIDAADVSRYPVLSEVHDLVYVRLREGRPTVGVCLGAQIMALALGATVRRGEREVGFASVTLTREARNTPLRHLEGAPTLHWHRDIVTLPDGATSLAFTAATPHQAFAYGNSLGIQFHPEADPEAVERWLIGHSGDLENWGIDPRELRASAHEHGDEATVAGVLLIREYVRGLGPVDSAG